MHNTNLIQMFIINECWHRTVLKIQALKETNIQLSKNICHTIPNYLKSIFVHNGPEEEFHTNYK